MRSTVCQLPTSELGGGWGGSAPGARTWRAELQAGPCPGSEGKCARVGQKGTLSQERFPPPRQYSAWSLCSIFPPCFYLLSSHLVICGLSGSPARTYTAQR